VSAKVGPGVDRVAVGRITRAHGVRGEVAVLSLSEVASRFEPGSVLLLGQGEGRLTVGSVRSHGHRLLVRFEEIDDRSAAERLGGEYLFVPASEVPVPAEGEFWTHQLVGCEVLTESGRHLGRVREVMRNPANDVWAADGPGGEVLIPALKDVVTSVDVAGGRIIVRDVPGLTVS
jgi:16S rRNA processing protein RimM